MFVHAEAFSYSDEGCPIKTSSLIHCISKLIRSGGKKPSASGALSISVCVCLCGSSWWWCVQLGRRENSGLLEG